MHHKMMHNGAQLGTKGDKKFHCEPCDFITCHSGHWKRHINTKKHCEVKMVHPCPKLETNYTCECGKKYTFHQGYYRHRKICKRLIEKEGVQDCLTAVKELVYTMKEFTKNIKPTIIQNHTNNNIMVYLNENCSNAMSIQDFVDTLSLSLVDLKKLKNDKPTAIASIVKQNLEPLSILDRPIHNTSTTNWYIKDRKEGWQEDTGDKMVKNVEHGILKQWSKVYESTHPEWITNSGQQTEYVELSNVASTEMDLKSKGKFIKKMKNILCDKLVI